MSASVKDRSESRTGSQLREGNVVAVDLFCGAGGLTHGLLDVGVSVVAGYDIDEACRHPFEHNNPPARFIGRSVSALKGEELARLYPPNSWRVLVGCAPCQPFSRYTQGSSAASDEKWGLLSHFGRLAEESMPDVVSMENVPELERHSVYDEFVCLLSRLGYHVSPHKVYCPDYGIPQHRTRLVLFASRLGPIRIIPPTHQPKRYMTVRRAIGNLKKIDAGGIYSRDPLHRTSRLSDTNRTRIRHSKPGGSWRDWPDELIAKCHRKKKGRTYPSVYGRMRWDEPSPTITTQFYGFGNGRFGHPEQNRAISLREGAILQTFPRDYEFVKPGDEYRFKVIGRLIGNAVPVRLGEVVGKTIKLHLSQHGK
ncbi:MAG: DNA (cytosine-5-)-methyltransferase [Candidatus Omnitrophica bacterium CG11_big_fil_rev_8_21_14_0_20_63_9]|nr:MAG: DNA (cytosine-5-)-methyltransferase [Candidatus Omnitrophica bacterium CG11_big_fil_rev_8_21_14_0_20_63_9]